MQQSVSVENATALKADGCVFVFVVNGVVTTLSTYPSQFWRQSFFMVRKKVTDLMVEFVECFGVKDSREALATSCPTRRR